MGQTSGADSGRPRIICKGRTHIAEYDTLRTQDSHYGAHVASYGWHLGIQVPNSQTWFESVWKFPCPDKFVALNWELRSKGIGRRPPLGDRHSLEFELALIEANERWNYALPDVEQLTGGDYRDYVSENSSQVGNRR